MQVANEQWVPLTEAARRIGVSQARLSTMVKNGEIKSRKDRKDRRKTWVDLNELNKYFYPPE
jgi:DNA-binding MarR family transcriptional regulator